MIHQLILLSTFDILSFLLLGTAFLVENISIIFKDILKFILELDLEM